MKLKNGKTKKQPDYAKLVEQRIAADAAINRLTNGKVKNMNELYNYREDNNLE